VVRPHAIFVTAFDCFHAEPSKKEALRDRGGEGGRLIHDGGVGVSGCEDPEGLDHLLPSIRKFLEALGNPLDSRPRNPAFRIYVTEESYYRADRFGASAPPLLELVFHTRALRVPVLESDPTERSNDADQRAAERERDGCPGRQHCEPTLDEQRDVPRRPGERAAIGAHKKKPCTVSSYALYTLGSLCLRGNALRSRVKKTGRYCGWRSRTGLEVLQAGSRIFRPYPR
jgi:hypothetical protein